MTTSMIYSKDPNTGLKTVVSQTWTQEEIDAHVSAVEERAPEEARLKRNLLLAETDWTASTDVTMTAEMTAYRQALRDVPAQAGFPTEVNWPTKP